MPWLHFDPKNGFPIEITDDDGEPIGQIVDIGFIRQTGMPTEVTIKLHLDGDETVLWPKQTLDPAIETINKMNNTMNNTINKNKIVVLGKSGVKVWGFDE